MGRHSETAVNDPFLNICLAVPSMLEKQTEKALLQCYMISAVTETSLGFVFFFYFFWFFLKMQFLDTAVVKLEVKIGIPQVVVPSLARCGCTKKLQLPF